MAVVCKRQMRTTMRAIRVEDWPPTIYLNLPLKRWLTDNDESMTSGFLRCNVLEYFCEYHWIKLSQIYIICKTLETRLFYSAVIVEEWYSTFSLILVECKLLTGLLAKIVVTANVFSNCKSWVRIALIQDLSRLEIFLTF